MISPLNFVKKLEMNEVEFFSGVPDSLLKNLCSCIDDNVDEYSHVIAANEGNAVSIAAGYYLATGKFAAVYMQNSGLGNSINPLVSLLDSEVYKIPVVLIVGWRGEPGVKDEPQHVKQGAVTIPQLEVLNIPYWIIDKDADINIVLNEALQKMKSELSPVAIVVKGGTFADYKKETSDISSSKMLREEALSIILENSGSDVIVSTTGKTSRELYELRDKRNEKQRDLLTVGSMGHASSIALGVSIGSPQKRVICLDGDGAMIMHMGAMAIIGDVAPVNYTHILLNNFSHESVGGQPTVADKMQFDKISLACRYKEYYRANDLESLRNAFIDSRSKEGPIFIEVLLKKGARENLGRPKTTPQENKKEFMEFLNEN